MGITYIASGIDMVQLGLSNKPLNQVGTYYATQSVQQEGCVLVGTAGFQLVDTGSITDTRVMVATNLGPSGSYTACNSASVIILASDSGGTKPITYVYNGSFPSRINWSSSLQPYAKAIGYPSFLQYYLIPS